MTRLAQLTTLVMIAALLAACRGNAAAPTTTPPPSLTPTPRSTALPPVGTTVPLGSALRPYVIALVPPSGSSTISLAAASTQESAPTSTPQITAAATAASTAESTLTAATESAVSTAQSTAQATSAGPLPLDGFLKQQTGFSFKLQLATSNAEILDTLCNGTPAFGWVDGLTMLAAQGQGCAVPLLEFREGTGADAATGVRADLVVRAASSIKEISGLKDQPFCRLNAQDVVSWILPTMMMRAAGFDPFTGLKGVKEYPDNATMLQAVADGDCVAAAIPAGTLTKYTVTDKDTPTDITKAILALSSSPEIPFGGLMASVTVPNNVSSQVAQILTGHPDSLKGYIPTAELVSASATTLADAETMARTGGVNFAQLGQ